MEHAAALWSNRGAARTGDAAGADEHSLAQQPQRLAHTFRITWRARGAGGGGWLRLWRRRGCSCMVTGSPAACMGCRGTTTA